MEQNNQNQAFHRSMIADLGTRQGTTLEDINSSSQWINRLSLTINFMD